MQVTELSLTGPSAYFEQSLGPGGWKKLTSLAYDIATHEVGGLGNLAFWSLPVERLTPYPITVR